MSTHNNDPPISAGYRVYVIVRKILIYLLAVVIVVAALLFAASNSPNKAIFGYRYYTVLTPSMEPTYNVGDMVFVKIENADAISVGEVITFNPSSDSEAYLTHRVTEKLTDYQGTGVTCFKTKGDANDSEDSFLIDESRVIGAVKFHIPKLGYIIRFIQLRWFFIVPMIVLLGVAFHLLKIYFSAEETEEGGEADTAETEEKSEQTITERE